MMLEVEMTDALGAEKGARTAARLGYRSGYYTRTLVNRVGKLELRVPRIATAGSRLSSSNATSLRAGVGGDAGGDVCAGGVSTRKVKAPVLRRRHHVPEMLKGNIR